VDRMVGRGKRGGVGSQRQAGYGNRCLTQMRAQARNEISGASAGSQWVKFPSIASCVRKLIRMSRTAAST
jgi:hypothetical protein